MSTRAIAGSAPGPRSLYLATFVATTCIGDSEFRPGCAGSARLPTRYGQKLQPAHRSGANRFFTGAFTRKSDRQGHPQCVGVRKDRNDPVRCKIHRETGGVEGKRLDGNAHYSLHDRGFFNRAS
jgi:hypothetical protein